MPHIIGICHHAGTTGIVGDHQIEEVTLSADDDVMLSDNDNDHHGDDEVTLPANTTPTEEVMAVNEATNNTELPVDVVMESVNRNTEQVDQLLVNEQVKAISDHHMPSVMDGDEFDQENSLTCHDGAMSSDHEDTPSKHKVTSNEHMCTPSDNQDTSDFNDIHTDHVGTPTDHVDTPTDHIDTPTDITDELLDNSVDKLFNDISVDELFDDV